MARQLEPLITKVEMLLATHFSDLRSGLEPAERADRVLGFVVSPDFEGLDHRKRQARLKSALEANLPAEELSLIGPIITMTPAEAEIGDTAA
jgi:hypothetical protein